MNNVSDSDNKNSEKDIKAFKYALDRFIGKMEGEWEKLGVYSEEDILLIAESPVTSPKMSRKEMFGCMRGQFKMTEDFNESLDDFLEYME